MKNIQMEDAQQAKDHYTKTHKQTNYYQFFQKNVDKQQSCEHYTNKNHG